MSTLPAPISASATASPFAGPRSSFAERYNRLLLATIGCALMAFAIADGKPLLLGVCVPALAVGYWLSRGPAALKPVTLSRLIINLLVLAAILHAGVRTFLAETGDPVVSNLGQFLVYLQLIKLFDRTTPRDDAQLLTLSVFTSIAAVLTSNTLPVGILLLIYTPIAFLTVMLHQIYAGQRGAVTVMSGAGGSGGAGGAGGVSVGLVTGPRSRASFARLFTVSLIACTLIASAIFVIAPRGLGNDVLGRFGQVRERSIGFTDTVRLGQAGLLSENPTPVMDVGVATADGAQAGSASQFLYLRGAARDRYDPQRMVWEETIPPSADGRRQTPATLFLFRGRNDRTAGVRVLRVQLRSGLPGNYLFTTWRPVEMTLDQPAQVVRSDGTLTLRRVDQGPGRLAYTVVCNTTDDVLDAEPAGKPGFQSGSVRVLAESIVRTRVSAERLSGRRVVTPEAPAEEKSSTPTSTSTSTGTGTNSSDEESSPRVLATAIRDYLRTEFSYTTELVAPPEGRDAIEYFLFDRKRGHCEYFASAMAAMCQSLGLHARIVTGYVTSEFSSVTGQYVVRESNAHAWVEVHVGRGRWQTFDPSPPADIERVHRPPAGVFAKIRSWYDALEFGWSSSVIGFDALKQSRLMGKSDGEPRQTTQAVNSIADSLAAQLRALAADGRQRRALLEQVALGLAGLAVLIAAWRIGVRVLGSRTKKRTASADVDDELAELLRSAGFYGESLRVLAAVGLAKPGSTPPLQFAAAGALSRNAEASRRFSELAELYYRVRFGRHRLSGDEQARAESLVRELREQLENEQAARGR